MNGLWLGVSIAIVVLCQRIQIPSLIGHWDRMDDAISQPNAIEVV